MKFSKYVPLRGHLAADDRPKLAFLNFINRKHRRRVWLAVSALLILTIIWSRFTAIQRIEISGAKIVQANDLQLIVEAQKKSKRWLIFPQSSIFFFDATVLERTIKNASPRIDKVIVKKHFPPSLSVIITEYAARGVWQNKNRYYEISQAGVILGEVTEPQTGEPIITDSTSVGDSQLGDQVITPDLMQKINIVSERLHNYLAVNIDSYDISKSSEYTIIARTTEGVKIFFSTHLSIAEQVQKLKIFSDQKQQQDLQWLNKLHYIDLRFASTRIYYQ